VYYSHPNTKLNTQNISKGAIYLYTNTSGSVFYLQSPQFRCAGLDSIQFTSVWRFTQYNSENMPLNYEKLPFTVAFLGPDGAVADSVTVPIPTLSSRDLTLEFTAAVPRGLDSCSVRVVAWGATYDNCGAIRKLLLEGVEASTSGGEETLLRGDLDGDGVLAINDVTLLIDLILNGSPSLAENPAADVDGNGSIDITDVTALIDRILNP